MAKQDHMKKYKDPRWQKKRLEILSRDEFTCQQCFDRESTLNVHHRYYRDNPETGKWCDPWDYPNEALVTLCESCHEWETEEMSGAIYELGQALKRHLFASEILSLAESIRHMNIPEHPEAIFSALQVALECEEVQSVLMTAYRAWIKQTVGAVKIGTAKDCG